jgi:hypothetical protein
MSGSPKKKSKRSAGKHGRSRPEPRTGMPGQDSVQKIVEFVSPQGVPYKILKTKEIDAYDVPQKARKKRIEPRGP